MVDVALWYSVYRALISEKGEFMPPSHGALKECKQFEHQETMLLRTFLSGLKRAWRVQESLDSAKICTSITVNIGELHFQAVYSGV